MQKPVNFIVGIVLALAGIVGMEETIGSHAIHYVLMWLLVFFLGVLLVMESHHCES